MKRVVRSSFSSSKVNFEEPEGIFWLLDKLLNYRAKEFFIPFFQIALFITLAILFFIFFYFGLIEPKTDIPDSFDPSWSGLLYLFDLRLESAIAYGSFKFFSALLGVCFFIGFILVAIEEDFYKSLWVVFFSLLSIGCAGICAMGGGVFLLSIIVYSIDNYRFPWVLLSEGVGLMILSFGVYAILRCSFINFFERVVLI
jgi:hypothetical protein